MALVDRTWSLSVSLGRVGASPALRDGWVEHHAPDGRRFYCEEATGLTQWARPAKLVSSAECPALYGPPLAMFAPGGGNAARPDWFDPEWGASGEQQSILLEAEFFADHGAVDDEPLRRTHARRFFTRSAAGLNLDVPCRGCAWGLVELSGIEALLVMSVDLPDGACRSPDVSIAPGERLYLSTQVWKGDRLRELRETLASLREELAEAERQASAGSGGGGVLATKAQVDRRKGLDARIKKLERALPQPGAPTIEVPGPWPGVVTLSTHGQVAVQRLSRGRLPNPFAETPQFGVVGSFVLGPQEEGRALESTAATEVDAVAR